MFQTSDVNECTPKKRKDRDIPHVAIIDDKCSSYCCETYHRGRRRLRSSASERSAFNLRLLSARI